MSCNEIKDRGDARSSRDRRSDKFPFEMLEKRTTKTEGVVATVEPG
jgi:hypothetical protein